MSNDSNKLSPEKSFWGWKLLIVAIILSCIFMGIFYMAITNDPEYMPSHQQQYTQKAFKTAPTMNNADQVQHQQATSEVMEMHNHHE